jgi:HlyD family secretion protein
MLGRRQLILASLVVVGAGFTLWLLSPRPVLVETAAVAEQAFTAFVEEDGRTRVRDRYVISAPLTGRIPRMPLRVGDAVAAGRVLLTIAPQTSPLIDPRTRGELEERVGAAQAAVEEAAALQERAKVQLTRARSDLERTAQLRARGVASVAQHDREQFAVEAADRDLVAADRRRHATEHTLEQARAALKRGAEAGSDERFPVSAPIDGRILKIIQESEGVVASGAPLLEVADPSDLEVIVDVLTSDAVRVREASRVILERSGTLAPLQGRVRRIEPSGFTKVSALGVEEQRVWIVIDIVSPRSDWSGLGDGYRVATKIVVDEIERTLVIPTGALFRRGDEWHVFTVENGRAQARTIDVARRSGRHAAVAGGLRAGDIVILYPASTLVPGNRVLSR